MADFTLAEPVDAAYNTFDSFRHLLDERSGAGTWSVWPAVFGRAASIFSAFISCRPTRRMNAPSVGRPGTAAPI